MTASVPPAAWLQRSSSPLIHRRAAPMPRISDSVSDSVWRVSKPASVRIVRSIRAGEMAATIASIFGSLGAAVSGSAPAPSDASVPAIAPMSRRFNTPNRSVELQSLNAHETVRHRAEPVELGGIGPQPMTMVEIHDRPILERDRRHLLEGLPPFAGVARRSRLVQELVDLRLAVAGVVERLLASVEAEDVSVGIGAPAPREDIRFELA